jgi:hypothetical protein
VIPSIIKSLTITLTISALITSALYAFGFQFVKTFCLVTAIQIGVWHLLSYVIGWLNDMKMKDIELRMIQEMSKQGVGVPCAHCKCENFIPITFHEDNDFECTDCKKMNGVYVEIETATKSEPLDKSNITISNAE